MKLALFAATGGIGNHALTQALDAGHQVTAIVRRPEGLDPRARLVQADLMQATPEVLAAALQGADAILSGLGQRTARDAGITSRGTRAIVQAAKTAGVERLVVISAAPLLTIPSPGRPVPPGDPGEGFLMRNVLSPIVKRVLRDVYADLAVMEDVVRESGLQWTVLRPPRLVDTPLTGKYRVAVDRSVRGGMKIGRADVAHHMLKVLEQPETCQHGLSEAY